MKSIKFALAIIIVITMFSLAGCDKKPTNKDIAESFVKSMLTVPNSQIAEVAKLTLADIDTEEYNEKMNKAVISVFGDAVAEDVINDTTTSFYTDVVMLHAMAAVKNYTYTVLSVEITKLSNKQFSYTAEVQTSNVAEGKITMTGSIQFDDAGKVNFATVRN